MKSTCISRTAVRERGAIDQTHQEEKGAMPRGTIGDGSVTVVHTLQVEGALVEATPILLASE
jgi:hypothetical protein